MPLLPRHKRLERLVRGDDVEISAAKHVEGVYAKLTHAVHLGGRRVANLRPGVVHPLTHSFETIRFDLCDSHSRLKRRSTEVVLLFLFFQHTRISYCQTLVSERRPRLFDHRVPGTQIDKRRLETHATDE